MMKTLSLTSLFALVITSTLQAEIVGKAVEYESAGATCEGWHAFDNSIKGNVPLF